MSVPPPAPPRPSGPTVSSARPASARTSRRALALIALGVAAVVLVVAGLGTTAYRLTGDLLSLEQQELAGPSMLTDDPSSSDRLLDGLEDAGLTCVLEVADPQVRSCYALHPSRWAHVSWQASPEGSVLGLWIDLDLSAGPFSSRDVVLGGLRAGLGLGTDEAGELTTGVEEALRYPGEEIWTETDWGDLYATASEDRSLLLEGYSWSGEARYSEPRALGPLAGAVALLETRGYRCEQAGEEMTSCTTADYEQVDLHGTSDLTGFDIVPFATTADVADELAALAPGPDATTVTALLDAVGVEPSATAADDWVVVHLDDRVQVVAGCW
ncbi:hypothetical protein [Auraticoccus monumenti]|uniref:Uncharacterized protein n=1 Tax=Auraticoccus monumenti TaxID=675864 RepID=A0A1G6RQ09_9ACTN|nr:hypothetical protein [Auraticoccus monumenti]SDD06444.1 hypothetical protein SAMN04489747_0081 [Auraticoccus monumenti]